MKPSIYIIPPICSILENGINVEKRVDWTLVLQHRIRGKVPIRHSPTFVDEGELIFNQLACIVLNFITKLVI